MKVGKSGRGDPRNQLTKHSLLKCRADRACLDEMMMELQRIEARLSFVTHDLAPDQISHRGVCVLRDALANVTAIRNRIEAEQEPAAPCRSVILRFPIRNPDSHRP